MIGAILNFGENTFIVLLRRIDRRRIGLWLLGLVVLSAIALGPWGLLGYVAGLLKSSMLMMFFILSSLVGWTILFLVACVRGVQGLRARRKTAAAFWSSLAVGIVLAIILQMTETTPAAIQFFGHGVFSRLEMQTDINAVQTWIDSLGPNECLDRPHSGSRGRHLSKEEQPQTLRHQNGMVHLELDAEDRPCVRLSWNESRAGRWGLVIGNKNMRPPPSDPNMYGEWRTELRPGVYFWYVEG